MARALGQDPRDIWREMPAPVVLEFFEFAEAKDMMGYLHMKQPGSNDAVETLKQGLNDMREILLIPLDEETKKEEHGEKIVNALMSWGLWDPTQMEGLQDG